MFIKLERGEERGRVGENMSVNRPDFKEGYSGLSLTITIGLGHVILISHVSFTEYLQMQGKLEGKELY